MGSHLWWFGLVVWWLRDGFPFTLCPKQGFKSIQVHQSKSTNTQGDLTSPLQCPRKNHNQSLRFNQLRLVEALHRQARDQLRRLSFAGTWPPFRFGYAQTICVKILRGIPCFTKPPSLALSPPSCQVAESKTKTSRGRTKK